MVWSWYLLFDKNFIILSKFIDLKQINLIKSVIYLYNANKLITEERLNKD